MKLIEKIRYQVAIQAVTDAIELKEGMLGYFCPFHEDSTGMLQLIESENRFSCSGCKQSGSSIDLVARVRGLTTDEAVTWIAERFDVEPDDGHAEDLLSAWKTEREATRPTLGNVLGKHISGTVLKQDRAIYAAIYEHAQPSQTASIYLEHKGFTEEQIATLGFRFIEKPRILLMDLEAQFSRDQLEGAGLLNRNMEFLFQQHALLLPFPDDKGAVRFLAGWDMGDRKRPIRFPRNKDIPPYAVPGSEPADILYVVEDLPGAMAFYRKGYGALAVPGRTDDPAILEHASGKRLSCCGEKDDAGNRFNREILKLANEHNLDCTMRETTPAFEDFLAYIVEKRK